MKQDDKKQLFVALGIASNIGFILVANLIVGLCLGRVADYLLEISPWGTVAGIVAGSIAGLHSTYKKLTNL